MRIVLRTTTAALLVVVASAAATAAPAKKPAEAAPAKGGEAAAAAKAGGSGKPAGAVPLLPGSSSKEPVNITADKLDFLNKDNKLVYTGNVVVVQGDTTMKASVLHIDLQKTDPAAGGATAPAGAPAGGDVGPGQGSSVRHMEADGPVTLISKDQIGTGGPRHLRQGRGQGLPQRQRDLEPRAQRDPGRPPGLRYDEQAGAGLLRTDQRRPRDERVHAGKFLAGRRYRETGQARTEEAGTEKGIQAARRGAWNAEGRSGRRLMTILNASANRG